MTETIEAAHLRRWLGRYGIPNPYKKWREADKADASLLAFIAIASEARILMDLKPRYARNLVRDALIMLNHIEAGTPATPQTTAAAKIVKGRLEIWQKYIRSLPVPDAEDRKPATAQAIDGARSVKRGDYEAARDALKDFPQIRASYAGFLLKTTLSLGSQGLLRLGTPMDMVFALGSARVTARISRGPAYGGIEPSRDRCLEVIGTLQEWSLLANKNALIVTGYPGKGDLIRRVLALALDANTCADLALECPGGSRTAGFGMWETAEEYHAYALMLFDNNPLNIMPFDQAMTLASAAGRLAKRAMLDPDVPLPDLPDFMDAATPIRVFNYAWALTGGSIAPRRSFEQHLPDWNRLADQLVAKTVRECAESTKGHQSVVIS